MTTVEEVGNVLGPVPAQFFRSSFYNVKNPQDPGLRILGSVRSCAYSSQLYTPSEGADQARRTRVLLKLEYTFLPGYRTSHEDIIVQMHLKGNTIIGFDAADGGENAHSDILAHDSEAQEEAKEVHRELGVYLDKVYQSRSKSRGEMSDRTPFVVYRAQENLKQTITLCIPGHTRQPASDPVTLRLAILVGIGPSSSHILLDTATDYRLHCTSKQRTLNYERQINSQSTDVLQMDSIAELAIARGKQPIGKDATRKEEEEASTPVSVHDSPLFGIRDNDETENAPSLKASATAVGGQQARFDNGIGDDHTVVPDLTTGGTQTTRQSASRRPRRHTTTERLGLPKPFYDTPEASGPRHMQEQETRHEVGPFLTAFGHVAFCLLAEDAIKIGMAAATVPRITEPWAVYLAMQTVHRVKTSGRTISVCEALRILCGSEEHSTKLVRESAVRATMYAAIWHAVRRETGSVVFLVSP